MKIKHLKSLNYSKKMRNNQKIQFLIIHYTGMQSARVSLKRLVNLKFKVSAHYFLDRKGNIIKLVDENKVAWHAGKSKWKNIKNLNNYSIGIEVQNQGHQIRYQKFTKKQINSLIKLIKILKRKYKIKNYNILGHSDIAPLRKIDPGEKFPWEMLSKKGIGLWYPKIISGKNSLQNHLKKRIFFKNIYKIGYRYFKISKEQSSDSKIVKAFQRRFLPKEITGKINAKTLKISELLAKKSYFS